MYQNPPEVYHPFLRYVISFPGVGTGHQVIEPGECLKKAAKRYIFQADEEKWEDKLLGKVVVSCNIFF